MENQSFTITIDATPDKVWDVLWNLETYPEWTKPFSATSNVKTDNWKKGSRVLFGDESGDGMIAYVEENIPNQFMSFKHVGMIMQGKENIGGEWGFENYTLKPIGDKTELLVEMPIPADYMEFFMDAWPKSMKIIKDLSEQ